MAFYPTYCPQCGETTGWGSSTGTHYNPGVVGGVCAECAPKYWERWKSIVDGFKKSAEKVVK